MESYAKLMYIMSRCASCKNQNIKIALLKGFNMLIINKYTADFLDFSECEGSLDCIMIEARGLVNDVYYSEREAIAADVLEGLQNEPQD